MIIQQKGTKYSSFIAKIGANKKAVWDTMAQVGGYHQFAPNIDHSEILSGKAQGMLRQCQHGKDQWTETFTLWEEEQEYAFVVDTDAPDYPYPFTILKGHWQVEAVNKQLSEIKMHFVFRYRHAFQNWLLHPVLRYQFGKVGEKLLDNWEQAILNIER